MFESAAQRMAPTGQTKCKIPATLVQFHRTVVSLPPEALSTARALGTNPRSTTPPSDEAHVLWSLEALSLSPCTDISELRTRVKSLKAALDVAQNSPEAFISKSDCHRMDEALKEAFRFLRWPQNRDRLLTLTGKAPTSKAETDNEAPPERKGLLARLFVSLRERS